jgi:hypothetical protein
VFCPECAAEAFGGLLDLWLSGAAVVIPGVRTGPMTSEVLQRPSRIRSPSFDADNEAKTSVWSSPPPPSPSSLSPRRSSSSPCWPCTSCPEAAGESVPSPSGCERMAHALASDRRNASTSDSRLQYAGFLTLTHRGSRAGTWRSAAWRRRPRACSGRPSGTAPPVIERRDMEAFVRWKRDADVGIVPLTIPRTRMVEPKMEAAGIEPASADAPARTSTSVGRSWSSPAGR